MTMLPALLLLVCLVNASAGVNIRVMSYNIWGWKDFWQRVSSMAKLICDNKVDVVGIQEGVEDAISGGGFTHRGGSFYVPNGGKYWRANELLKRMNSGCSRKNCWGQYYQIMYNRCNGVGIGQTFRYDLPDGPKYRRTGEKAKLTKGGVTFSFLNNHWDHQAPNTHATAAYNVVKAAGGDTRAIIVGDFNTGRNSATDYITKAGFFYALNIGIDYVMARGLKRTSTHTIGGGYPRSDHPILVVGFST